MQSRHPRLRPGLLCRGTSSLTAWQARRGLQRVLKSPTDSTRLPAGPAERPLEPVSPEVSNRAWATNEPTQYWGLKATLAPWPPHRTRQLQPRPLPQAMGSAGHHKKSPSRRHRPHLPGQGRARRARPRKLGVNPRPPPKLRPKRRTRRRKLRPLDPRRDQSLRTLARPSTRQTPERCSNPWLKSQRARSRKRWIEPEQSSR